jgi:hypothetical protein
MALSLLFPSWVAMMTDCHEFVDPGITNPNVNTHSSRHIVIKRVPSLLDTVFSTITRCTMLRLFICFLEWNFISREMASQSSVLIGIITERVKEYVHHRQGRSE